MEIGIFYYFGFRTKRFRLANGFKLLGTRTVVDLVECGSGNSERCGLARVTRPLHLTIRVVMRAAAPSAPHTHQQPRMRILWSLRVARDIILKRANKIYKQKEMMSMHI